MSEIVVHGMIGSPFVRSVLVALEEKGLPYRLIALRLDALRTPDYLAIHPFRRVPVFEHDGFRLRETQAILRHIDRAWPEPALTPRGLVAAARMDETLNSIDAYLFNEAGAVLGFQRIIAPRFLKQPSDEAACAKAEKKVSRAVAVFAKDFGDGASMTRPDLSLADIALACHLDFLAPTPEGGRVLAQYSSLDAWRTGMTQRPSFVATTIESLARRFIPRRT